MINRTLLILLVFSTSLFSQKGALSGTINDVSDTKLSLVNVYIPILDKGNITNSDGKYSIENLPFGNYWVIISSVGFHTFQDSISISKKETVLNLKLQPANEELQPVNVSGKSGQNQVYNRLKNIDGVAIYAAKKSEIIEPQKLTANLSANNARQVFARVAGINVWESDAAGLQLGVAARGLSPNRTSNFNTRQNGYDIAADALGYPESYYAPPMQAIQRIEIVRGAASLQYGTQFGGMLNLKLKKGNPHKKWSGKTVNTYNSQGFFNTYNELGGQNGKLNYYGFSNFRQGSGFREKHGFLCEHQSHSIGLRNFQPTDYQW